MGIIRRQLKKSAWGRAKLRNGVIKKNQPDYARLNLEAKEIAPEAKRILFATSHGGWMLGPTMESFLAAALRARGHEVHVLLCDGVLPACFECETDLIPEASKLVESGPQERLCADCTQHWVKTYEQLGVTVHRYSDWILEEEKQTAQEIANTVPTEHISKFKQLGVNIGEHALAGALRYYGRADLEGEPEGEAVLRRYLDAAFKTFYVAKRLLKDIEFESVVFHHGIYVPQGLIGSVARDESIRVVNWNPIWRKGTFIFSHEDTYHHTLLKDDNSQWENMEWTSKKEKRLMEYLDARRHGKDDWIWFHKDPSFGRKEIEQETGIDFSRPVTGLLTNVLWDAQLHYSDNAFRNMMDWMTKTIAWFKEHPEKQLLIRVHPAELRGAVPSRQPIMGEIERLFPEIPENVKIIRPESSISTYAAMEACDAVIIYGTKTGMELSAQGIPVIIAGEAWLRHKGIGRDMISEGQYYKALEDLPIGKRLEGDIAIRAKKYAYHFIFERMLPLPCFEPAKDGLHAKLRVPEVKELMPGAMPGLDVILEGILKGKPFIIKDV